MKKESDIMNTLPAPLKNDYAYYSAKINNTGYENFLIKPDDVLRAHYLMTDYFQAEGEQVLYGVKSVNLLYSAIARPETSYSNQAKWKTPLEKCATLFYGLVKNHPFHDGNKRTALLIALYNLQQIHRIPTAPQSDFERLTVNTAASQLSKYKQYKKYKDSPNADVYTIANLFRRYTKKSDRRFYSLTFKELNQRLQPYGYVLDNPDKQYITLYKKATTFTKKPRQVYIRQIGFPGWSKQVNEKAMKCILNDIGVQDTYNFYQGGEPLYKLIDDYNGPLRRLKDK